MFFSKKNLILLRMTFRGYSERNNKDELYLHRVLRASSDLEEFKAICIVLGKSGGLFSVPTLMAFANDSNKQQAKLAKEAIAKIQSRVIEKENEEMKNFFNPAWWRPKWIAGTASFISYVACIANILNNADPFDSETMDKTAAMLMNEIDINLSPHHSFNELKLCTPDWEAKADLKSILAAVEEDIIMQSLIKDKNISIHPDTQYEENLRIMRCDYLLTRLKLQVNYEQFRYLLQVAGGLNSVGR
jgi:hypothetical protein